MKKRTSKLLSLLLTLTMVLGMLPAMSQVAYAAGDVAIDATNFPDANFRTFVQDYDTNSDGKLSEAELAAVTKMNCVAKDIADLTGIEHFTALTVLDCYDNKLTTLDVNNNTALTELYCYNNQLTSLDVSKNTALTYLDCGTNQLTALDVSANIALTYVRCTDNQLTSLDVSKNTALTTLYCSNNQLTTLDVSKNTQLTTLWCYGNQLTTLDVSANTALTYLWCYNNQLTTLDVSKNTALKWLHCYGNNLTMLDVSAVPALKDAKENGTFDDSSSEYDRYSSSQGRLVVDKTVNIITDTSSLGIAIDAANFPDANFRDFVKTYDKDNNGYLSEAELAAVTEMDCHSKDIADLTGIEHFTALTVLDCYDNKLTTLDVSKNTQLKTLWCSGNQLTTLDVSANTALTVLDCGGNNLTELDVSAHTALTELYCFDNNLTELDVSKNTALTELWCYNNQLTTLDVSANTALTRLWCWANDLTELDVSKNTALTALDCGGNQLTTLDVSANTALTELWCYGNNLTTLDVSKNTALTELVCYGNNLTTLDVTEVPALKDAKENGTFDDSNSEYDRYSSLQGTLRVDKGFTNIITVTGGNSSGGGYTYYTIKATAGVNGAISPSGSVSVRSGKDQTFTITPDKGYAISDVKIDGKSVGASYTFENVKGNHTIKAIFMKANGNPQTGVFVDVPEGSYYEEAVAWAVENGITKGTSDTTFDPNGICTRAQAVTFLWRAAGSPEPKSNVMPFEDVAAEAYYYKAVLWAVENGITKGTSETTFSPDADCTRAQIVTFLWRAQKSPAADSVNPFTDVAADAYYVDAVLWAVEEKVTKGTSETTFSPDADCTRAQIVTFLYRALNEQ